VGADKHIRIVQILRWGCALWAAPSFFLPSCNDILIRILIFLLDLISVYAREPTVFFWGRKGVGNVLILSDFHICTWMGNLQGYGHNSRTHCLLDLWPTKVGKDLVYWSVPALYGICNELYHITLWFLALTCMESSNVYLVLLILHSRVVALNRTIKQKCD